MELWWLAMSPLAIIDIMLLMSPRRNVVLQRLWNRIRHDEERHRHWLQMALHGHIPGAGMGQMGRRPKAGMAPPTYRPGAIVVPTEAHMPEQVGKAARVVEVVTDQPFYSVDFGTGHPHRWYRQDELRRAPRGTAPGEQVGG